MKIFRLVLSASIKTLFLKMGEMFFINIMYEEDRFTYMLLKIYVCSYDEWGQDSAYFLPFKKHILFTN